MPALTTIGFDADDTLWHNERFFQLTEARFRELLADHAGADLVSSRRLEAERRNLGHYGFGIKGFVLSMIETALDVTGDTASPAIVRQILDAGREMLEQLCAPVSVYTPSGRHYWHLLASPALGSQPALMPCVATVLGVH